jgi:hypothetical protein
MIVDGIRLPLLIIAIVSFALHCAAQRVPEAVRAIAPNDFVELQSKSGCMDACPIYSVRLRADGTVTWNGIQGVETQGPATRHVSPDEASALIQRYRAVWNLRNLPSGGEDAPEVITTLHIGDRQESINGTPDWEIYRAVGLLAGTYNWIRGDPRQQSLDALQIPDSEFAPKPGVTGLMRAVAARQIAEIKRELAAGANVNAQDASGFTALMYASWLSHTEILRILLKSGADASLRSYRGQTAIMAASTGIRFAEENIQMLVAAGADLNAQDHDGNSALMLAAGSAFTLRLPNPEEIAFLIGAGARRNLRNTSELTAADNVTAALSHATEQSLMLEGFNLPNKVERQAALLERREKLRQVRQILLLP